jgi:fructose-1,6-bisphosphatase/inositol monophosphatase family enzyme
LAGGDLDIDRADLRDRLAVAVREAGVLALKTFRGNPKSWIKGKSSPVSEADLAVDALLRDGARDPQCRLAVGETEDDRPGCKKLKSGWSIPLTPEPYLAGSPDWTISVALVERSPGGHRCSARHGRAVFVHIGEALRSMKCVSIPVQDELAGRGFSGQNVDSTLCGVEPRIETRRACLRTLRLARSQAARLTLHRA